MPRDYAEEKGIKGRNIQRNNWSISRLQIRGVEKDDPAKMVKEIAQQK